MSAVITERARPGVELVTLNRPERLNAIDVSLLDGLYAALARIARDESCAVVVLTGAGRGFCAGLDLKGIGPSSVSAGLEGPAAGMRGQAYFGDAVATLRRLPQPVVAAINGPAYGGGLALANACDLRIAAESARFSTQAIRVGMSGGEMGTTYLLPRLVGAARAHELILTARDFDPAEGERIGLLSRVVPDGTVVDVALDVAAAMAERGRAAPRACQAPPPSQPRHSRPGHGPRTHVLNRVNRRGARRRRGRWGARARIRGGSWPGRRPPTPGPVPRTGSRRSARAAASVPQNASPAPVESTAATVWGGTRTLRRWSAYQAPRAPSVTTAAGQPARHQRGGGARRPFGARVVGRWWIAREGGGLALVHDDDVREPEDVVGDRAGRRRVQDRERRRARAISSAARTASGGTSSWTSRTLASPTIRPCRCTCSSSRNAFGAERDDDRVLGVVGHDDRREPGRHVRQPRDPGDVDALGLQRGDHLVARRVGAEAADQGGRRTLTGGGDRLVQPLAPRPRPEVGGGDGLAGVRHAGGAQGEVEVEAADDRDLDPAPLRFHRETLSRPATRSRAGR